MELEETRFRETLNQGMEMLESYLIDNFGAEEQRGERLFPGEMAFRLYDTYGFPLDLTKEIVAEKGLKVDEEDFNLALQEQKSRGRRAHKAVSYTHLDCIRDSEEGTLLFIGATTENPFFHLTSPLLSRIRIFIFQKLSDAEIVQLLHRALKDTERGLGKIKILADDEADVYKRQATSR